MTTRRYRSATNVTAMATRLTTLSAPTMLPSRVPPTKAAIAAFEAVLTPAAIRMALAASRKTPAAGKARHGEGQSIDIGDAGHRGQQEQPRVAGLTGHRFGHQHDDGDESGQLQDGAEVEGILDLQVVDVRSRRLASSATAHRRPQAARLPPPLRAKESRERVRA